MKMLINVARNSTGGFDLWTEDVDGLRIINWMPETTTWEPIPHEEQRGKTMRITGVNCEGSLEDFDTSNSETFSEVNTQNRGCDTCKHEVRPAYKAPCISCKWLNEDDNWEEKQ